MNLINLKSPLLAFIKFGPTFLTGSLAVCLSAPVQGEAGVRGVWGGIPPAEPREFRSDIFKQTPPSFTFSEIELYVSFFQPVMKLKNKERIGSKGKKNTITNSIQIA